VREAANPQRVQLATSCASSGSRTRRSDAGAGADADAGAGAGAGAGADADAGAEDTVDVDVDGDDAVAPVLASSLFTHFPRGNPVDPESPCHSMYARSDAAMLASSARGSSLATVLLSGKR
jgi:hypothetical protein